MSKSKPNLPININYVLEEKKTNGFSTKQIIFFIIGGILIFFIMNIYNKYESKNKLIKDIEKLQIGDNVTINSINGIISKIDYHTIYLGAINGTGSIPILKKNIQKIENFTKK